MKPTMRRVIVESPFAPRTARPEAMDACSHGDEIRSPVCSNCVKQINAVRAYESALHARYLDACLLDCLYRGEAPFASHGLYTRPHVIEDMRPEERIQGITAGFLWRRVAHATVAYVDLGWSEGMRHGEWDAIAVRQAQMASRELMVHQLEIRNLPASAMQKVRDDVQNPRPDGKDDSADHAALRPSSDGDGTNTGG